jgi:hypothetical protein
VRRPALQGPAYWLPIDPHDEAVVDELYRRLRAQARALAALDRALDREPRPDLGEGEG